MTGLSNIPHAALAAASIGAAAVLMYKYRRNALLAYRRRKHRAPKLILHFDVNETIMIGDPAGGDTFEASLNKAICKSAFVKLVSGGPVCEVLSATTTADLLWWDGTPLEAGYSVSQCKPPPLYTKWEWPQGCAPFYKIGALKKHAKKFTEVGSPGQVYRPLYEQLERALRLPSSLDKVDPRISHDGLHFFLLPAFFATMYELYAAGRDFAIVVRTFGTDGPNVAHAMSAWAEDNAHPGVPAVPSLGIDPACAVWRGRYDKDGTISFRSEPVAGGRAHSLNEQEALCMMEALDAPSSRPRGCVCADDYSWWKEHAYLPSAGKPLWLTLDNASTHHIFFDDNIHNDPSDSIVAVRMRATSQEPFLPQSGEATCRLQGIFLVRVPTVEPILNPFWFLERIAECEKARASAFHTTTDQHVVLGAR
mmetsp:Transcript_58581/g.96710  ORF Transcript_58581/g.96710 Transcript_58581/m.96710 type:complete len:422 (+) Transcript_58581:80-1345(+)|eukprot:CAMPEP_0119314426 /NCGR_PEP_ID=MMETSP1333-20130426/32704_1 /TAXON_ID=418940 /ORGANISM="Scyphosphaera apsteinii, Strain RCC1455" /LENGTH=421 /DNA_ID=CAMNT_0007319531 /DNA_START=73 /DNA_END=1338 /DNA_ORIENTATION=+